MYERRCTARSRRHFSDRGAGAGTLGNSGRVYEGSAGNAIQRTECLWSFVGHGTPRSAVWTNEWTASWEKLGAKLPRPSAILSISAHWLTRGGALVTASRQPRMNYDFYGFPEEMYKVVYPAPG